GDPAGRRDERVRAVGVGPRAAAGRRPERLLDPTADAADAGEHAARLRRLTVDAGGVRDRGPGGPRPRRAAGRGAAERVARAARHRVWLLRSHGGEHGELIHETLAHALPHVDEHDYPEASYRWSAAAPYVGVALVRYEAAASDSARAYVTRRKL